MHIVVYSLPTRSSRLGFSAQEHPKFKAFCASDEAAIRKRLVYPDALYARILDFAKRRNPTMSSLMTPSITKQEFDDHYHEYVTAPADS